MQATVRKANLVDQKRHRRFAFDVDDVLPEQRQPLLAHRRLQAVFDRGYAGPGGIAPIPTYRSGILFREIVKETHQRTSRR